jgi:hypothetical protein
LIGSRSGLNEKFSENLTSINNGDIIEEDEKSSSLIDKERYKHEGNLEKWNFD